MILKNQSICIDRYYVVQLKIIIIIMILLDVTNIDDCFHMHVCVSNRNNLY